MDEAPILIVGTGLAGTSVAREFRKLGQRAPLVLVTEDDGNYYFKPAVSNALAGGKTPADLVLMTREALAAQLGAGIHAHVRAERILPGEHVLETSAGRMAYRKLVLAVGACPMRLQMQGDGADDVLSVNSLADYARFACMLKDRKSVAIIGAGLIGCEFACDLRSAGHQVRVFDVAPQPLCRLLPPQAAAFFRARLEACGIVFSCGACISRITREGGAFLLTDSQGAEYRADMVLSAVGLVPATGLAREAGLKTGRGIVADRELRTSGADIFALGDCAEVGGLVLPYVMPIMQAARSLARTLAEIPAPPGEILYPAMPVVVKTGACPAVVCPPLAGSRGAWRETADASGVRAVFEDEAGRVGGFALVGDAVREKQALTSQIPPWL